MIDTPDRPTPIDTDTDFTAQSSETESDRKRLEAFLAFNKAALFDALADTNITRIVVSVYGDGDSAQVDCIEAFAGDESLGVPDVSITIATDIRGDDEIISAPMTLSSALQELAYDFLSDTRSGLENDDGAVGNFVFDIAQRSVTLADAQRLVTQVRL